MFSQYGSNLTPDGNVFKTLGAIVQASAAPAQSIALSEACPTSVLSDSLPGETTVGSSPDVPPAFSAQDEVNSAGSKERRSKMFHDRPAKVLARSRSAPVSAAPAVAERPAPSAALALGDFLSTPAIPGLDAPVVRGLRSKATPVEITRKSARKVGDISEPVLDRAVRLTADKNAPSTKLTPSSKKTPKGTQLDPIFAILQNVPDAHLLSVAADCCVLFPADPQAAAETLSLIRANELAQADLASTRCRLEQEKALAATSLPEDSTVMGKPGGDPMTACPEGSQPCPSSEAAGAVCASSPLQQRSPSPPRATARRRAKSVAPQGRRPVTRQARANGVQF